MKAMHFPSTMSGDEEVKNAGQAFVSFRQSTLPVAASRQERTPPTPNVQTFPSATVGELRGPGCPPPGPLTACAAYLSSHTGLPLAASRQAVTSSLSLRAKT